jgi:hypothetical protein
MMNAVIEALTDKTTAEYKVIEAKYWILRRLIRNYFDVHRGMCKEDAVLILSALEDFEEEDNDDE